MKKEKTTPKAANVARTVARKELERLRQRQTGLLMRLAIRMTDMAAHVANRQIPAIPAMTDAGVLMSIGEALMANQTLEGILGTMERIAQGITAAPAPRAGTGDIPAPGTETTQ